MFCERNVGHCFMMQEKQQTTNNSEWALKNNLKKNHTIFRFKFSMQAKSISDNLQSKLTKVQTDSLTLYIPAKQMKKHKTKPNLSFKICNSRTPTLVHFEIQHLQKGDEK